RRGLVDQIVVVTGLADIRDARNVVGRQGYDTRLAVHRGHGVQHRGIDFAHAGRWIDLQTVADLDAAQQLCGSDGQFEAARAIDAAIHQDLVAHLRYDSHRRTEADGQRVAALNRGLDVPADREVGSG